MGRCFLHATTNTWLAGFVVMWAVVWFIGMDVSKVVTYHFVQKYYEDLEGDALGKRKMQKRLSVAVESERRATMAGAQRRSLQKKHAAAAGGADVSKLTQRVTSVEKRVSALEQEQKDL